MVTSVNIFKEKGLSLLMQKVASRLRGQLNRLGSILKGLQFHCFQKVLRLIFVTLLTDYRFLCHCL